MCDSALKKETLEGTSTALRFLKFRDVAVCYAALKDIDRREVWGMWTNASHRVRGCGRQTGKKIAFRGMEEKGRK